MKATLALFGGAGLALAVAARAASLSAPTTYRGMCDASAAVSLNADLFAVANDEDNILRVYHRQPGLKLLTAVKTDNSSLFFA